MSKDQTKTPGAMMLVPFEPTRDMLCSGWTSVVGKLDHESIAQLWQAMIKTAPAEQPPGVGGEPEVMRYGLFEDYVCVLPAELDALEARIAPLLAEIECLKCDCKVANSVINAQKARIAQLEAAQGEAAAWIVSWADEGEYYKTLRSADRAKKFQNDKDFIVEPLYRQAQPATAKLEMADVVKAHMEIPHCPVLTSNQCHALAVKLNAKLNGGV